MTTQGPAQVRLPALTVLRAAVTCQLMLDGGVVSCQVALWGASLRPAQPACSIRIQSLHGRSESGGCTNGSNVELHFKPLCACSAQSCAIDHGDSLHYFSNPSVSMRSTLPVSSHEPQVKRRARVCCCP